MIVEQKATNKSKLYSIKYSLFAWPKLNAKILNATERRSALFAFLLQNWNIYILNISFFFFFWIRQNIKHSATHISTLIWFRIFKTHQTFLNVHKEQTHWNWIIFEAYKNLVAKSCAIYWFVVREIWGRLSFGGSRIFCNVTVNLVNLFVFQAIFGWCVWDICTVMFFEWSANS